MLPFFSIISPSYNKESYILDMIDSIIKQSFENWELIIIDDASSDNTPAVLNSLPKDSRIKICLNKTNNGANHCRNQGLKLASANHVIFFDADDLMVYNALELRKNTIENDSDQDLWIFNMGLFNRKINDVPASMDWTAPNQSEDLIGMFLKHDIPWSIMQTVWRKDFIIELKGFDEVFEKFQDVEMHTRALLKHPKINTYSHLAPDVYYRVDDERKNFSPVKFYTRTVKASVLYYQKFFKQVNSKQQKQLVGTLFEPLTGICFQKRIQTITKVEFDVLKDQLIQACQSKPQQRILNRYQKIESWFPFHPKGLKQIFKIRLGLK